MTLAHWISDIAAAAAKFEGAGVMDIRQPASPALSKAGADSGFPGVLPLWGGRLQTIGLLAEPSSVPQKWPVVILSKGQGLTLASDSRTLVPQLIVQRVLSNLPETAERFAERWKSVESITVALHRVLGGTEQTLEDAVAVVRDSKDRAAFTYQKEAEAVFEAAHSRLERQVDRSEPFVRYADWLDACIGGRCPPVEDPSRYGSWGRRVLCWANRLARRQQPVQEVPAPLLHRVIEGHAGIDSGVPIKPSWSARPGAASGETALLEAARQLEHEPPTGDAVSDGLVRALLTEGLGYRGYAHAEAAAALDERGESTRAWASLQSAAWWAARSTNEVSVAMIQAAKSMAERQKWGDVHWVIERSTKAT
jgi:hypothetical protein